MSGKGEPALGKVCPVCGAAMPEEAHFCLACFSLVADAPQAHRPSPTPQKRSGLPGGRRAAERIVAAVLLLVLTVGTLTSVLDAGNLSVQAPPKQTDDAPQTLGEGTAADANEPGKAAAASPSPQGNAGAGSVQQGSLLPQSSGLSSVLQPSVTAPGAGSSFGASAGTTTGSSVEPPSETPAPDKNGAANAAPAKPEYDSFEYEAYSSTGNRITLTKYTGNASKVTVPAVIDGKPVARIARNTFSGDAGIREITFESDAQQTLLWLDAGCMTDLPALTVVRLPDTNLGVYGGFAENCPSLREIAVDNSQYRFENGALYYWSSQKWLLRYYAPACTNETLTIPSWCAGIEGVCNLHENPYLKRIDMHKNTTSFPMDNMVNDALEAVNVEAGNPRAFSVDGVLFRKSDSGQYSFSLYPPGKKDKSFRLPENVCLSILNIRCPYLEEIWIPKSSGVDSPDSLYFRKSFPNLKRICLQTGHSYEAQCRSTFTGTTELYEKGD